MSIRYLDLDDLLLTVDALHSPVRDLGMLASAAARPHTTVYGVDAYPDLPTKTAALMHSLARNHPLVDGNKRLAWIAGRLFLRLNGTVLNPTQDEAFNTVMALAAGQIEVAELARWIADHTAETSPT